MAKEGILLTIAAVVILVLLLTVFALFKWRKRRAHLKRKAAEYLSRRCYRVMSILGILTDRYLTVQTKLLLVEYVLSVIPEVTSITRDQELVVRQLELKELRDELQMGEQATINDKVTTDVQLARVQSALQALPSLIKGLAINKVVDKATAKHHVELVRYANSLAHYDLLVRQADFDLDADKKARALEKLRTALAEMERVASISDSRREMTRLKNQIKVVEKALFSSKEES